jgi:diacylglycerol kinase (ATP)
MTYRLIMNPASRAGRSRRRWGLWERGLREAGVAFDRLETRDRTQAIQATRDGASEGRVIVAVGGDGTINAALDGILQSGQPAPRLGVLYAGTSPDFCRFHGLPVDPAAALRTVLGGRLRRIDAGRIEYADAGGALRRAHFGCSVNLGLGAAIARRANHWRPFAGDVAGTAVATLWALCHCPRVDLTLCLDGQHLALGGTNNLSVLKDPFLASGLKLTLELRPDDGRLALAAVQGRGLAGLLRLLPRFYDGSAVAQGGLLVRYARRVEIHSATPCELEFDGDPRGFTPARIEVLPGAVELLA